jgi:hypothetical protein
MRSLTKENDMIINKTYWNGMKKISSGFTAGKFCIVVILCIMVSAVGIVALQIKKDETIIFYPTIASYNESTGMWDIPVHGHVFEKDEDSYIRKSVVESLQKDFNINDKQMSEIFNRRLRLFMVDNQGWKQLQIQFGSKEFTLENTSMNGHIQQTVHLSDSEVKNLRHSMGDMQKMEFRAKMPEGDNRIFAGTVYLSAGKDTFLISDIDDTIKVSDVRNKTALMTNTFCVPFKAVPGMAGLYQSFAKKGVVAYYVSASPWQQYTELEEFLKRDGFPDGIFCLKFVRLKDISVKNIFVKGFEYKTESIEPVIKRFTSARFILVGDSGEQDPEAYGVLAAKYPQNIMKILIRNAYNENDSARYLKAFKDIPRTKWQIFTQPDEVKPFLSEL